MVGYHVYVSKESGQYGAGGRAYVTTDTMIRVSGLVEGTTYYFVVTAYDDTGLESEYSNEVEYTVPLPVLRMERIEAAGLPTAFSIVSSGTPARWTLEASEDLSNWKPLVTGTDAPANVTVLVTPSPAMFFRLGSDASDAELVIDRLSDSAFPDSFVVTTKDAAPPRWTLEFSQNLLSWSEFTSGTNLPLKLALIVSKAQSMFFRLKGQ